MGSSLKPSRASLLLLAVACLLASPFQALNLNHQHKRSLRSTTTKHAQSATGNIMPASPPPPVWPDSFMVSYELTLPYVQSVQSGGLKYPVTVYYDGPMKSMRLDAYYGLDSIYVLPDLTYSVYPRILTKVCSVANTTIGPTGELTSGGTPPPLPDLRSWTYAGEASLPNAPGKVLVWQLGQKQAEKVNSYSFYVTQDGKPVKLYMLGLNLMTGSHFDEYIVDFTNFRAVPSPMPENYIKPPALCKGAMPLASTAPTAQRLAAQLTSLLPSLNIAGTPSETRQRLQGLAATTAALAAQQQQQQQEPGAGAIASGLSSPSPASSAYLANKALVEQWNSMGANGGSKPSYRLALNKFASWSHERWVSTLLMAPQAPGAAEARRKAREASPHFLGTYRRVLRDEELPQSVDWRGTGADGIVKDQASCGSCWAFATSGAMQAAWFLATGESLSFSEQQLVDCSWDFGNNGCSGGWMEPALSYAAWHGGVVLEEEYQYKGQNTFCRENKTSGRQGLFRGFATLPPYDESALMEAVALHGPVAISLNAALPPFKFYSEGVYHNPECHTDADHLDHAVVVVGYGTTQDGVDYWLIRNSWSKFWGQDGYAKITRKGNDCGITVDPVLAVVDKAHQAVQGAAQPGSAAATAIAEARAKAWGAGHAPRVASK